MFKFFKNLFLGSGIEENKNNSLAKIIKILKKKGYSNIDFSISGYQLFVFDDDDVKVYIYPERDGIRVTCIPTGEKYNLENKIILKSKKFGNIVVLPQKHKSNPEIMFKIPVDKLTFEMFNESEDFLIRYTHRIYSNFANIQKVSIFSEMAHCYECTLVMSCENNKSEVSISSGNAKSLLNGVGIIFI